MRRMPWLLATPRLLFGALAGAAVSAVHAADFSRPVQALAYIGLLLACVMLATLESMARDVADLKRGPEATGLLYAFGDPYAFPRFIGTMAGIIAACVTFRLFGEILR
jgi:1,4-dihydroxy-2-naphthoate octaprenyltransferase